MVKFDYLPNHQSTFTISQPGLIFDLDGTLWDASATCALGWNSALRDLGINQQIDAGTVRSFSGMRIHDVLRQYFSFVAEHLHPILLENYRAHESALMPNHGGKLYPGVAATLGLLHSRYPLYIVSNCLAGYIENFLRFHQVNHLFTDFECSGKTGLPKHENIRLLMNRNLITHAFYIGDTVWDQEAAAQNNVPFIFAGYGFGQAINPRCCLPAFAELPALLEKIGARPDTNHL